jgi:hypothetical protein
MYVYEILAFVFGPERTSCRFLALFDPACEKWIEIRVSVLGSTKPRFCTAYGLL